MSESYAKRALSSYAFNNYGHDAKLYNGIHDLESVVVTAWEWFGCMKELMAAHDATAPGSLERKQADERHCVKSQAVKLRMVSALVNLERQQNGGQKGDKSASGKV